MIFNTLHSLVTGSASTQIAPYRAAVTEMFHLTSRQRPERGGELRCELEGEHMLISVTAVKYLLGAVSLIF